MLPERISNDLCSLREMEDRPALAVRTDFQCRRAQEITQVPPHHDALGRQGCSWRPGASRHRRRPDDKTGPILDTVLKPLWNAYAVLTRGRDAREPLELDLPEKKILLTPEGKQWTKSSCRNASDAHKLIEDPRFRPMCLPPKRCERTGTPAAYFPHSRWNRRWPRQETLREFLAYAGSQSCQGRATRSPRSSIAFWRRSMAQTIRNSSIRSCCTAEPGRIQPRQYRPFWPASAPLCGISPHQSAVMLI